MASGMEGEMTTGRFLRDLVGFTGMIGMLYGWVIVGHCAGF